MATIHDNGIDRPMTPEEVQTLEQSLAEIQADEQKAKAEQEAALEARKAPLRRIGLTEDEITIVLGL